MSSLKMRGLWVNDDFFFFCFVSLYEPLHDKASSVSVRPAKTQISLGIRPFWSESLLSAWRNLGSLPNERTVKTLIRLGGCLGWSESSLGAQVLLLVLSCLCSYYHYFRMVYSPAVTLYILLRLKEKVKVKNWTTEKQLKTCIQIQHGRNL